MQYKHTTITIVHQLLTNNPVSNNHRSVMNPKADADQTQIRTVALVTKPAIIGVVKLVVSTPLHSANFNGTGCYGDLNATD